MQTTTAADLQATTCRVQASTKSSKSIRTKASAILWAVTYSLALTGYIYYEGYLQ